MKKALKGVIKLIKSIKFYAVETSLLKSSSVINATGNRDHLKTLVLGGYSAFLFYYNEGSNKAELMMEVRGNRGAALKLEIDVGISWIKV